eukprot:6504175-Prymnesium_polylepis.3
MDADEERIVDHLHRLEQGTVLLDLREQPPLLVGPQVQLPPRVDPIEVLEHHVWILRPHQERNGARRAWRTLVRGTLPWDRDDSRVASTEPASLKESHGACPRLYQSCKVTRGVRRRFGARRGALQGIAHEGRAALACRSASVVERLRVRVVLRQRGHQEGGLALAARLEDEAIVRRVEEEGARARVGEHLDEHILGREREHVVLREDAEALADLAEDERRIVLELEVVVVVRRRLARAPGHEVAVPLLVKVGGREAARRCVGKLADRGTDAHEHHEDKLEVVVALRDEVARRDALALVLGLLARGGGLHSFSGQYQYGARRGCQGRDHPPITQRHTIYRLTSR